MVEIEDTEYLNACETYDELREVAQLRIAQSGIEYLIVTKNDVVRRYIAYYYCVDALTNEMFAPSNLVTQYEVDSCSEARVLLARFAVDTSFY